MHICCTGAVQHLGLRLQVSLALLSLALRLGGFCQGSLRGLHRRRHLGAVRACDALLQQLQLVLLQLQLLRQAACTTSFSMW